MTNENITESTNLAYLAVLTVWLPVLAGPAAVLVIVICCYRLKSSSHYEAPVNQEDGNEARAEDTTEPQWLQRNPAYCQAEMMKKTPITIYYSEALLLCLYTTS